MLNNDVLSFNSNFRNKIIKPSDMLCKSYSEFSMLEYLKNSVNDLSLQVVSLKKEINNFSLHHTDLNSKVVLNRLEDRLFYLEEMRSIRLSRLNSLISQGKKRLNGCC